MARVELERQRNRYLEHPDFARLEAEKTAEGGERESQRRRAQKQADLRLGLRVLAYWGSVAAATCLMR